MRSRRTNVIGILVADIEPFSAELLKGAARAHPGHRLRADRLLRQRPRQGALRAGSGATSPGSAARSPTGSSSSRPTVVDVDDAAPIVIVDPHTGPPSLPTVHADNLAGAITATEHLIGLGHRRIGFLAGRPDLESARLREQGYRDALAAAGIALDPQLVGVGEYELETSEEPARRLLQLDEPPTAIFAANDLSAMQTMHVARVARPVGARRRVGDRLRQHPRVGAHRAAADDDRPVDPADGRPRPCGCSSTSSTATPSAPAAGHAADPARRPPVLPGRSPDERRSPRAGADAGATGTRRSRSASGSPTCSPA